MIVAFMGAYGFAFAVISPVLMPLAKAFNISIPTAAYISTFMFIGAAIMSIPAGLIVDRWGIKKAGILALVLLVLGWLTTYVAPSFDAVLAGRVIIGMGGITMGVMGAAAVVQWFNPKDLMLPMGLWVAGLPLGIAWGEVLAGVVISSFAWRASMLTGFIIGVIGLVVVAAIVRPGPFSPGARPAERSKKEGTLSVFKNKEVWKFNFALFFGFISFMGVTTYWVT
ncbi:MAG: MFS transporter [Candidatus Micrarchaeaceae archaeon]